MTDEAPRPLREETALLGTSPRIRRGLEVALLGVAAIWGSTFVTVKQAVERVPVFEFLALRYVVAALVLTGLFWRHLRRLSRAGLKAGILAGLALLAGYTAQTTGLEYTRATNAGFVTGLFVVFAPILSAVVLRRRPATGAIFAVALAVTGLAMLTLRNGLHVGYGDAIVLLAAVSFAAHIVILARYAPEHSPAGLAAVQMWVVAVPAVLLTFVVEHPVAPTATPVWRGALITGLFASALAFLIQTSAQRYVSATRTAIILVTEPAFAGLFGIWLLGDSLSLRGWIGAALILVAMLVAELSPERRVASGA
jgi:drug/metabolite transporter (DMT)-like permease